MQRRIKIFNKLVRDNIPDIIHNNGEKCITRVLENNEYRCELYKKLTEEVNEVKNADNPTDLLEELADVLEILKSIAELEEKSLDDVIEVANAKRLKRGGFKNRIFWKKQCRYALFFFEKILD